MRYRVILIIMGVLLLAGFAIVIYSGLNEPSGAATGEAGGCGGGPAVGDEDVAPDLILGGDVGEAQLPVMLTYQAPAGTASCPTLVLEPADMVATFEDSCKEPGMVRVWDLTAGDQAAVLEAYQATRDSACNSKECLTVLLPTQETHNINLESPMREQIRSLLDKAVDVPAEEAMGTQKPQPTAPAQTGSSVLTLKAEQGADFGSGALVDPGHPLKADLVCYAGSNSLDCQAGAGPTVADQKHLKLLRTPGGTIASYDSLDQVPTSLPTVSDRDMLRGVKAGTAFVLENNLTESSYTRAWVKKVGPTSMTLEFEVFGAD